MSSAPVLVDRPQHPGLRQRGLSAWQALERRLDSLTARRSTRCATWVRWAHCAFWLLAASGTLLFILLDTSVKEPGARSTGLADWPLGLGGLLRGLHRYAADLLPAGHCWRTCCASGWPAMPGLAPLPWLTGVPLLGFVSSPPSVASGSTGTSWASSRRSPRPSGWTRCRCSHRRWRATFPPVASVSDRLFSLFVFVHLGVPLLLLFGLWFHIQRI
jgi:hypothetical protein